MRKLILAGVLAAVAIPSIATAQERNDRRENRQDMRQDQRRDVRHDRREVRQDRREFHRDRVAYVAPYNSWRYRTISPGYRLQSSFFGSRYYVNNYNAYQLRAPNRWQRWIRYGDDLVLVNTRTGRVIQVVRNRY
jgi:Ni/Co efflux regulator RcnB